LTGVICVKEQLQPISKLLISIVMFWKVERGKEFCQIFTCFDFIVRDSTDLFSIVLMWGKFIGVFNIRNSPIKINLIEHNLLFSIVLFLWFLFIKYLCILLRHRSFRLSIIFNLLFIDNHGVSVVLYSFIVSSKHEVGIGFTEVMLDHVIVAEL
jgi:hypothetical protein